MTDEYLTEMLKRLDEPKSNPINESKAQIGTIDLGMLLSQIKKRYGGDSFLTIFADGSGSINNEDGTQTYSFDNLEELAAW